MSRVRWYHYYFVLALFDVLIILLSLRMHGRTISSAAGLIESAVDLDEQSRWLQLTQQRVIDLNAPGNDVFQMRDFDLHLRRFEVAKRNLREVLDAGKNLKSPLNVPTEPMEAMVAAAQEIFDEFKRFFASEATAEDRLQSLTTAGKAMARMDTQQHELLGALSVLFQRNAEKRDRLLLQHESELQQRVNSERYFIAAVVLVLVGILWFGRRLQRYDRELQEQRRMVEEERRERLAAIGELCTSVAHGIRNPLAAIRSSAQLTMELGQMDQNSKERLGDILNEGRRLGDRVTGLLSMARATSCGFSPVNLLQIVTRAVRELSPAFSERGLTIEQDIDPAEIMVMGDRHQLEQVVIELLSNALDHSKSGDCVRVACRRVSENGTVAIEVADQGPGVPERIRRRIFDLFFTTKAGGTGIGLATIKRYAKLHGGDTVLVPSSRGACFRFTMPVAPPGTCAVSSIQTGDSDASKIERYSKGNDSHPMQGPDSERARQEEMR
ncbi:MAG: HAMP domain-containing histidine kinase [Planctomycetia bacterium]|nr:HAMP domain-containing histidine kinase [Planctomycetia bacterium]MCC7316225.1 HAMP domain-containing histidine kinase [Planctomycetota bacterium]